MKKVMILFAASAVLAACKGGSTDVAPLEFESYDSVVTATGPEGGMAGLELKMDIPIGEGERQENVSAGIREIIKQSEVGQELEQPIEGSLKGIADALVGYFPIGVEKGDLEASGTTYHLWIESETQSSQAVVFRVEDGIFGNGGPSVRYATIRYSDGKVMDDKEVFNITGDDIAALVKKYGTAEQKEVDEAFIGPDGYLCPVGDSCRVLYLEGAHFWNIVTVPVNEITKFLTEEGKKLFEIPDVSASDTSHAETDVAVEPETAKQAEPGRGELGIFDLRGPVRECKWKNADGTTTYTFDADGYWLTKNGTAIIGGVYPGRVDRNKDGRITHGYLDEYKETQHEFTYNDKGLVTMINYQEYMDGGYVEEFKYDEDGYVKSIKSYNTGMDAINEETGEEDDPIIRNYTILEKDEIGNWTKRKSKQGTETRVITYY